ncbi:DUF7504 family protein [Haloglomus litoreum]|uniref:DUF7504 family protein n=1 Tax=Haloglomus litoreum TaxID=3034026 RepID=UPI0023E76FC6|nr:hypothetical protein [Haloglomus sp. DT116]
MPPGTRTERAGEFADALGRLQRDGGALLVVGATPGATHERACARMLGSREQPRVVCRTDGSCSVGAAHAGPDDRLIDLGIDARGAVASADDAGGGATVGTETGPAAGPERILTETPAEFGARVSEAIASLPDDVDDPRVCVDSLLPLVEALGEERAFEWYHAVAADVRAAGGVCHAHLPVARDEELVARFEALVDATVELRLVDGRHEQRWFVHDSVTSDWLPLQD